jgi:hypothetical protein
LHLCRPNSFSCFVLFAFRPWTTIARRLCRRYGTGGGQNDIPGQLA